MTDKPPDDADQHKAGKLPGDAKQGTKPVAQLVPRVHTVRDLLTGARKRVAEKSKEDVCTTGHYKLDKITGGIRKGFCWLFGADTSFGKSSWLISVADENILDDKRVMIVSSEDTEEIYGDRLMIRRAQVDAMRFRDRVLDAAEFQRVLDVEKRAEPVPVFIDARRWAVEDLAGHLKKIIAEQDIDVVAFDYVQEFRSNRKWQDERVKYREICSVLRHVAKDAKIAALLFSQLTMAADTKVPTRANIRECRDIANASEVILIGFEPDQDVKRQDQSVAIEKGTKCILVDKVKNGPRGAKIAMDWDKTTASFRRVISEEQKRYEQVTGGQFDDFGDQTPPPHWSETT